MVRARMLSRKPEASCSTWSTIASTNASACSGQSPRTAYAGDGQRQIDGVSAGGRQPIVVDARSEAVGRRWVGQPFGRAARNLLRSCPTVSTCDCTPFHSPARAPGSAGNRSPGGRPAGRHRHGVPPPRQLGAVAPTNRGRAARQPARWTSTAVTTAHASSRCTSASVRAWDRRVGATAPMRWYAACQRTEKESLGVCRPARPWRRTARAPNGLHQRDQVGAGHPEHPGRRRARPQSARGCLHQRDGAVHEGPVRVGLGRGPCLCDRVTGQLGPAVEADYPPVAEHPRRERGPSRDTPVPRRPSRARPGCGSRETLLRWFMNVLLL